MHRYYISIYILNPDVMWGGSIPPKVHPKSKQWFFLTIIKNKIRCVFYITVADYYVCGIAEYLDRRAYGVTYKTPDYLLVRRKYHLSIHICVWCELHGFVLRVVTPYYPYGVLMVVHAEGPSVHLVPIHLVPSTDKVFICVIYKEIVAYNMTHVSADPHIS